jgi:tetratricopeptide (TPR) repeat protein
MEELQSNHPDKAAEYFIQAIAVDSKQKHYYNNLAAAYLRLGEYKKSEEHLNKALELDGSYARALSNMSVTLFHQGRYIESYNYYILAKKADSEYSKKRFNKKRVSLYIKKLSQGKPEDTALKRINDYIESDLKE